jgi:serine/threonine protein kinase
VVICLFGLVRLFVRLFGFASYFFYFIGDRDLAARNVLLRIDIDKPEAIPECVLVDMGLSRLYDREEIYMKTRTASMPLKWSAPGLFNYLFVWMLWLIVLLDLKNFTELLREKKFSEKSDIWSFGVVSVEIFTRDNPFMEYAPVDVSSET